MPATKTARTAVLSKGQLALLAEHGEERRAEIGDVLFRVGDRRYPLIAIIEGEAAILDQTGAEINRHRAFGFLGEANLLSGQTVFCTAVVTEPMRYIAVEREELRTVLFENSALSDLLLWAFIARREGLQARAGVGIEIVGPHSSEATRQLVEFARRNGLPFTWLDTDRSERTEALAQVAGLPDDEIPVVHLPGGAELRNPSAGQVSRALGIGLDLGRTETVDLLVVGGGPAGLGAAVYGASEGLDTLVVDGSALGGQAGTSRRIENYLGFPAGISGSELTVRALSQAWKFGARMATPYRAVALEPGAGHHLVRLESGEDLKARAVVLATGAEYRRLPIPDIESYEGVSIFYAAGPPEARQCVATRVGVVGGGNSAAQAAIWLARGGALVTLFHRRADLSETMSDYLIHDLERAGVLVRGRSEIAALHGADGQLDAVTLRGGERITLSHLFFFLGAAPRTDWLGGAVALDDDGFILTGPQAGAEAILETSVPRVFAVGDVRSGSVKRCATAVGEGATVMRFIHERFSGDNHDGPFARAGIPPTRREEHSASRS
jgi:thioredoxin reductase (NADPH)